MNTTKDKRKQVAGMMTGKQRKFTTANHNTYHSSRSKGSAMNRALPMKLHYDRQLSNQCKRQRDEWTHKYNQQGGTNTAPDKF